jgi:uncharacterized PurR-regulated membrane protein YhhQ (DUF165 family)
MSSFSLAKTSKIKNEQRRRVWAGLVQAIIVSAMICVFYSPARADTHKPHFKQDHLL